MAPTIRDGGRVLVNRLAYRRAEPRVGDIVVLRRTSEGELVVKRVVDVVGRGVIVAGDNGGSSVDSRAYGVVATTQLIGRVITLGNYRSE